MKYSCLGCKHAPYKRENVLCTRCGKYVPSEDGDSTVYIHANWTPKEVVTMCEYCQEKKNLLRHPKDIDYSEALIKNNKISLAIATGEKIGDKPVRNCYEIPIDYCPKCGREL